MGSQIDRKNPRKKMVQIELKFNVPSMRNLSSKSEKQSHVSQQPVRHLTSLNPRLPSMHASACWSPHLALTRHLGLPATLASSTFDLNTCEGIPEQ